MNNNRNHAIRSKLFWRLGLAILLIVSTASALSMTASILVRHMFFESPNDITAIVLGVVLRDFFFPGAIILVSLLITIPVAQAAINPVIAVSNATKRIAKGDFSTRLPDMKHNDEISQMARNFNTMADELQRNQILKKDFAANISHQFKTPLAIISGYAQLLEETSVTDEERIKYAGLIARESQRLVSLSSDILRLSKLESQEIVVSPSTFLLDEQILQSIVLLEPGWTAKNIEFNIDLPEIHYCGDEDLLSQVWLNIIDNAIKYTADGGEIVVTCQQDKNTLRISVSDNGIGMDEDTLKNAFVQYYRGTSADNAAYSGSGLGLSIAKRITELHGGSISISSAVGQGCTITVSLPINGV